MVRARVAAFWINQAPHNMEFVAVDFRLRFSGCALFAIAENTTISRSRTKRQSMRNIKTGATATFLTSTGESPGTNRLEITGDLAK